MRKVWWIIPDRSSSRQRQWTRAKFWNAYEAAAACGLEFGLHDPGSVVVDAIGAGQGKITQGKITQGKITQGKIKPRPEVFVEGEPAGPAVADRQRQAGHGAVPGRLPGAADPHVPVRHRAGRLDHRRRVGGRPAVPVVVKPAGWGGGLGIVLAEDERELRSVASLAGGSDCDLVCQPYLGDGTAADYRLYIVDGRVHTTMRRVPQPGDVVANTGRGGTAEYLDLPAELAGVVGYLTEKFPIPYFCADFLFDGRDFHLSEVELDGAYAPDHNGRTTGLLEARFTACARQHDRFLGRTLIGA